MGNGNGTKNGGGGHNNGTGTGQGEDLVNTEKEANLDYARKATDLILNRLQGQLSRGKVDEKLLKKSWAGPRTRFAVSSNARAARHRATQAAILRQTCSIRRHHAAWN